MYKILITLIILANTVSSYAIESIEIGSQDESYFSSNLIFTSPIKTELEAYLELGDSLSKQKVTILSLTKETYRVSVQLETSMSISDEGPHLDLTDWKHCTTDWVEATASNQSVFKLPDFDTIDTDCFPEVSQDEIKAEVLKQGGQHWVDVIERTGVQEEYSPIYIGLSTVRIKIEKQLNTGWQKVTTINVSVPLGC